MSAPKIPEEFLAKPAEREKITALVGVIGYAKSGKTASGLLLARGLAGPEGRVIVVDSEGRRSNIYQNWRGVGEFMRIDLMPPFSSLRYYEALSAAMAQGADVVVLDSVSHEHEGEGGFLDFVAQEEQRLAGKRNVPIAKWQKPRADHNRFMNLVRRATCHIVMTIREKRTINDKGDKVELPVCNADLPFEMTLLVRLEPETHRADWRQTPEPLAPHVQSGDLITIEHGEMLAKGLAEGIEPDHELEAALSNATDKAREEGTDAAVAYVKKLPEGVRARLRPHWARLEKMGKATDARLAAEARTDGGDGGAGGDLSLDGGGGDRLPGELGGQE